MVCITGMYMEILFVGGRKRMTHDLTGYCSQEQEQRLTVSLQAPCWLRAAFTLAHGCISMTTDPWPSRGLVCVRRKLAVLVLPEIFALVLEAWAL